LIEEKVLQENKNWEHQKIPSRTQQRNPKQFTTLGRNHHPMVVQLT